MKSQTIKENLIEKNNQLKKSTINKSQMSKGNLMNNSKPIEQGSSEQNTSKNKNTPKGLFNYKVPMEDVKNYLDLRWKLGPDSPRVRKEYKRLEQLRNGSSKNKVTVNK